ncbi:MAG: hypothetical protein JXA46_18865 [Dehalococcoidales bacterium]|nr:hypothetical protein [Dehalococcoidales bacterium]
MGKVIVVLLAAVLVFVLVPSTVAQAAESGSSSGSFSVGGVAPNVTALEVYSNSACTTVAAAMTPQVIYYVKVSVTDANTLDDIKEVKLKIFYDPNATHPDESTIAAGHEQTAAIFTWTKIGNAWAVDAGAGTSWAAVSASSVVPTMTESSGDWIFAVKLGKVATESMSPNVWDLHARATDDADYTAGRYLWDKSVVWYGEVQINTANINFGEVELGSGFAADVNKVTGISAHFIANGDYASNVRSSATWTGTGNIATLDPNGNCVNAGEFAIKAYHADIYGSAYLINTTGVNCRDGAQTLETGDSISTGTFWLKIATVFPTDVYSGTITFTIVNR